MINPRNNPKKQSILARAARTAVPVTLCVALLTQLGAEGADQPSTQPTSQPTTQASNHNATTQHSVTSAPGGGLILNFKEVPITTVLDELSATAGFIIVPVAKPTGRITLISRIRTNLTGKSEEKRTADADGRQPATPNPTPNRAETRRVS